VCVCVDGDEEALPALGHSNAVAEWSPHRGGSGGSGSVVRSDFLKGSAMSMQQMKAALISSGESVNDFRLKKMLSYVFALRKELDALKALTADKAASLDAMERQTAAMAKSDSNLGGMVKGYEHRLKALEMKLSTVSIKINETEENRKNYALNIAHLKEEETERFYQLEGLRKQCAENEAMCRKMNEIKLQLIEDKERAEHEKACFDDEISSFRGFMSEQLNKFHAIAAVAKARREKRDLEKATRHRRVREKLAARVSKLHEEMEEKDKQATVMSQQLESVNERLRYFEKRFQQVASATGLTDPDEIINKFILKEEIRHELSEDITRKQQMMKTLQEELDGLNRELAEAKTQYVDSRWKDVHHMQEQVRQSQSYATSLQRDSDRLRQQLAYFAEGLVQLFAYMPSEMRAADVQTDVDFFAQPESVLQLLTHVEEHLGRLADEVRRGEVQAAEHERELERAALAARRAREEALARQVAAEKNVTAIFNLTKRLAGSAGPSSARA